MSERAAREQPAKPGGPLFIAQHSGMCDQPLAAFLCDLGWRLMCLPAKPLRLRLALPIVPRGDKVLDQSHERSQELDSSATIQYPCSAASFMMTLATRAREWSSTVIKTSAFVASRAHLESARSDAFTNSSRTIYLGPGY
ncbi:hypothetical protein XH98_16590 [Bradyrhizobium sp. CCBAU 51745]|nr:hypothetical protein [Bradyrhizobium sp. CCBAU 51745]